MLLTMTKAPTDGYSPRFDLTSEEILGFRTSQPVYFYFKLNGLYGKGRVLFLLYRPGVGITDCDPRFSVQPDGSTNVETTSW